MSVAEAMEALSPAGELDAEHIKAVEDESIRTMRAVNEANELIKQAKEEREQAEREAGGRRFTVEDFARVDPEMAAQMRARSEDQLRYDALVAQTGVPDNGKIKSPAVINAAAVLPGAHRADGGVRRRAEQEVRDPLERGRQRRRLISKDLTIQENSARRLEDLYNRQAAELRKLHQRRAAGLEHPGTPPIATTRRPRCTGRPLDPP